MICENTRERYDVVFRSWKKESHNSLNGLEIHGISIVDGVTHLNGTAIIKSGNSLYSESHAPKLIKNEER
jgi:hypothetical protein